MLPAEQRSQEFHLATHNIGKNSSRRIRATSFELWIAFDTEEPDNRLSYKVVVKRKRLHLHATKKLFGTSTNILGLLDPQCAAVKANFHVFCLGDIWHHLAALEGVFADCTTMLVCQANALSAPFATPRNVTKVAAIVAANTSTEKVLRHYGDGFACCQKRKVFHKDVDEPDQIIVRFSLPSHSTANGPYPVLMANFVIRLFENHTGTVSCSIDR